MDSDALRRRAGGRYNPHSLRSTPVMVGGVQTTVGPRALRSRSHSVAKKALACLLTIVPGIGHLVLDRDGVVHSILALTANDPTLLRPEIPYLYALEMPAGWWAANGVAVGARFRIPSGVEGLAE